MSDRKNVYKIHYIFYPLREILVALAYLGKATRAALPIPTGVCSIFVCPSSALCVVFFNVRTAVYTSVCDCAQGQCGHRTLDVV